ncbi:MAG: hypothetical protein WAK95_07515, partial [Desulfobacterales bacterium]
SIERGQPVREPACDHIAGMEQPGIDRRRIAEQAEPPSPKPSRWVPVQIFKSGYNALHGRSLGI